MLLLDLLDIPVGAGMYYFCVIDVKTEHREIKCFGQNHTGIRLPFPIVHCSSKYTRNYIDNMLFHYDEVHIKAKIEK